MLSITLPHLWEDDGELILHLLEECSSADKLNALVRSRETSAQSGMSLRRFLVPCTMFSAPPVIPTPNCTGKNVPGSFFLLEVTHDCRADELVESGPYGNGPYCATIFLGYGNQPSTKEVWSEVLWNELVVGSYPLLA